MPCSCFADRSSRCGDVVWGADHRAELTLYRLKLNDSVKQKEFTIR